MRVNPYANQSAVTTQSKGASKNQRIDRASEAGRVDRAETSGGARAEISARAKDAAKAKSAAMSAPDVREQKIAELKRRISEGAYNVDANAVADRMVDDHLSMKGLG